MKLPLTLATVLVAAGLARAADKHAELLRYLPESANAVVLCDVNGLYQSPLAKKEQWLTKQPISAFPPWIKEVVLGSKFNPAQSQGEVWEVGAAKLNRYVNLEQLRENEKGAMETVAGRPAVLSPRNVYFIELNRDTAGVHRPADRQELAGWLKFLRNASAPVLSPYLAAAAKELGADTQVLLALDLTDLVGEELVRERMKGSEVAKKSGADAAVLAKKIAGVKGLKMFVKVADAIGARITIDFEENVEKLRPFALPMFLEILARRGASVDSLDTFQAEVIGTAITFTGELSQTGFRQLLSLVQLPSPTEARAAGTAVIDEIRQQRTQHYFNTVETVIADLKKADRKADGMQESRLWYERYAEKIDHLPRESVDEELLAWGKDVAYKLRAIAASLRGEIVQVGTLEGSKSITILAVPSFSRGGRYATPTYGGGDSNVGMVNLKQGEISAQARLARLQIWDNINEITSTMRNKMTTKFKTPFSPMP